MPDPMSWLNNPLMPQSWPGQVDPTGAPAPSGTLGNIADAIPDVAHNLYDQPGATLRGFAAGALEGLRPYTSPLGIGMSVGAMFGGGSALADEVPSAVGGAAMRGLAQAAPQASMPEAQLGASDLARNASLLREGPRAGNLGNWDGNTPDLQAPQAAPVAPLTGNAAHIQEHLNEAYPGDRIGAATLRANLGIRPQGTTTKW
jgi:hypothetical protein